MGSEHMRAAKHHARLAVIHLGKALTPTPSNLAAAWRATTPYVVQVFAVGVFLVLNTAQLARILRVDEARDVQVRPFGTMTRYSAITTLSISLTIAFLLIIHKPHASHRGLTFHALVSHAIYLLSFSLVVVIAGFMSYIFSANSNMCGETLWGRFGLCRAYNDARYLCIPMLIFAVLLAQALIIQLFLPTSNFSSVRSVRIEDARRRELFRDEDFAAEAEVYSVSSSSSDLRITTPLSSSNQVPARKPVAQVTEHPYRDVPDEEDVTNRPETIVVRNNTTSTQPPGYNSVDDQSSIIDLHSLGAGSSRVTSWDASSNRTFRV